MDNKLVEVTRSFSYKLNTGKYETRDFFCSQKSECYEDEAEAVSEKLYQFCKKEVIKSLNDWKEMNTVSAKTPEEEYFKETGMVDLGNGNGVFPKVYTQTKKEKEFYEKEEYKPKYQVDDNGEKIKIKKVNSNPY